MSEARMESQIGVDRGNVGNRIVFNTKRGEVSLGRETGVPGVSGEVWVARGWNGLRHGTDPVVVLERFVPQGRAARMAAAMEAFTDINNQ